VTPFDIIHIAERLGQVTTGSPEADLTIHEALGLDGPVLRYTQEGWAARGLLPVGFEWMPPTYTGGKIYAGCRRSRVGGDGHIHAMGNGVTRRRLRCAARPCGLMPRW
jgi:hypothetical protein